MRDTTSLPWPAVRGAWATSMHDLEEGRLTWQDATQWSLSHLSPWPLLNLPRPLNLKEYVNSSTKGPAPMKQPTDSTDTHAHIVTDREK